VSEREQPSASAPIAAGPQPASAATDAPPHAPTRSVLSADQRALLDAVLDRLVPANGPVPPAGALGCAAAIDASLGRDPALRRLFFEGLTTIALGGFAEAPDPDAALREVEAAAPGFFAALVDHAYRAYYTDPRLLANLERTTGYPARPPQPLGHDMPPWDPDLLARQRQRAPFWRPIS
jgi:Gluconate 2-dehydrogenase subunit 3